jgi:hypothetical protein
MKGAIGRVRVFPAGRVLQIIAGKPGKEVSL